MYALHVVAYFSVISASVETKKFNILAS